MSFISSALYKRRRQATAADIATRAEARKARRVASLSKAATKAAGSSRKGRARNLPTRKVKLRRDGLTSTATHINEESTTDSSFQRGAVTYIDRRPSRTRTSVVTARLFAFYWQWVERWADNAGLGVTRPPTRRWRKTPTAQALERLAAARSVEPPGKRKRPRVKYPVREWERYTMPSPELPHLLERLALGAEVERKAQHRRARLRPLEERQRLERRGRPLLDPGDSEVLRNVEYTPLLEQGLTQLPAPPSADKPRRCVNACGECGKCRAFRSVLRQHRQACDLEVERRRQVVAAGGVRYWLAPDYDSPIINDSPFPPVEATAGSYPTGGSWVKH